MSEAARKRDAVYALWTVRPADQRTDAHVEGFADETYRDGHRLGSNENTHLQIVRTTIQSRVVKD